MDYFKFLPMEITLNILTRLPAESVLECKLVCTNWRSHIRHHSFKNMVHLYHLNHPAVHSGKMGFIANTKNRSHGAENFHYFEYSESDSLPIQRIRKINLLTLRSDTRLVGSSNGLICFAGGPFAWICNPITREYVILPEIKRDLGSYGESLYTTGFGYLSATSEYKIVGVYTAETEFVEVYIYTLGSRNGWRKLENFNFESGREWCQGVFANGALYWLDAELEMIVSFDLAEEKFCEHLSPPPLPTGGRWRDYTIGILDGFLYVAVRDRQVGNFDLWMLKKKSTVNHEMEEQEGHQSSMWSDEFRIDGENLLAITKSYGVLTKGVDYLSIYDTKTSTMKRLVTFKDLLFRVFPHKNSLISMKELGEGDAETMDTSDDDEEITSANIEETTGPDYTIEQL